MLPESGATDIAAAVKRFTAAWQSGGPPPDPMDYLPTAPTLRRIALVELVKIDLRHRWTDRDDSTPKRLADYCREIPELASWPLPPDLIYEEFHVRRAAGGSVDAAEYSQTYAAQLESMLETGEYDSTMMTPGSSPHSDSAGVYALELDDIDAGDHINDFDLMTSLGRGAFARVFLARQRSMQRLVAVKLSRNRGTEPQTLAQLDHEYIVRVFDQRLLDGGTLRLLYMQYVPGGTLHGVVQRVQVVPPTQRSGQLLLDVVDSVLADKGEIRPSESTVRAALAGRTWPETVAWLGLRLAQALDYAGRQGVLHRDIKPANVLLTAEGVPKLADFNISFGTGVSGASPVAYFGGSLAYMSPEQLAAIHPDRPGTAADMDQRSDLYSLAVVLWELLTGTKPFEDDDVVGGDRTTLDKMLDRRAEVHDTLPADTPGALRRVLLKALAPQPDQRWSSGAEMAQQLSVVLDPRARDLVDPPPDSWRVRLRRWTHPIMGLATAVPNALALWYAYNHVNQLITSKLDADTERRFEQFVVAVYAVAYAAGAFVTITSVLYLLSVASGLRHGKSYDPAALARARRDTLRVGHKTALFCFNLWVWTGIGIPIVLGLLGVRLSAEQYVHFFAMQLVCGGIAVVYPTYLVNLCAACTRSSCRTGTSAAKTNRCWWPSTAARRCTWVRRRRSHCSGWRVRPSSRPPTCRT